MANNCAETYNGDVYEGGCNDWHMNGKNMSRFKKKRELVEFVLKKKWEIRNNPMTNNLTRDRLAPTDTQSYKMQIYIVSALMTVF